MSCKKEIPLQLTHLFFKALLLIFIFSSCSKEEIYQSENPQTIPNQSPTKFAESYFLLEKNKQEPSVNTELQNAKYVLTMEKHIRDLTLNTFYATYLYPQLRGLTGSPIADPRTGCPCSSLSTVGGINTMTLDYDNCTTLGGATYDGTVTVEITGVLDVDGTIVDIAFSDDFTIDGGDIDGSLSMTYEDNGLTNSYAITDLFLSNTANGTDVTEVEIGAGGNGGRIRVGVVGTNSGPLDLLDDNFTYEEAMLEIHCPDGTGLSSFINTTIVFNILCGVPQDGSIQLSRMFDGSPYAEIDFGYTNIAMPGDCDNIVAVYLASDPTMPVEVIID